MDQHTQSPRERGEANTHRVNGLYRVPSTITGLTTSVLVQHRRKESQSRKLLHDSQSTLPQQCSQERLESHRSSQQQTKVKSFVSGKKRFLDSQIEKLILMNQSVPKRGSQPFTCSTIKQESAFSAITCSLIDKVEDEVNLFEPRVVAAETLTIR